MLKQDKETIKRLFCVVKSQKPTLCCAIQIFYAAVTQKVPSYELQILVNLNRATERCVKLSKLKGNSKNKDNITRYNAKNFQKNNMNDYQRMNVFQSLLISIL